MNPVTLFAPPGDHYEVTELEAANALLSEHHYLGPARRGTAFGQFADGALVAVQVWRRPAARHLPNDGTWWELCRWCLTPAAGDNAGSRQHGRFVRWLRQAQPQVTTLVSYSDPSQGHTGSLYRACNWRWAPTWHRLRPPPSGNGSWDGGNTVQSVKDRWIFDVGRDGSRDDILSIKDQTAAKHLAQQDAP